MRWRSPSKPFDSVLPPSFRREQSYCPGSSLGSVETTEITSRRDYDRLYDRLEVSVLGVRLGLMPARGLRVVPLLDPLAVMASVALSRLPSDPQMPRLQLTVSTGEINLKLSSEMLKQVTRLGVACLRTSQKTNQDFEQLRQRFELMARKGTSMTRLSSYLNFSAEGMFGGREEEDMLPVRLSAGGCGDLTEGGTAERGSSSLFPAGSERADVSPLPDFYDARSIASLGSSTSSRRSPSMGRVPASNERDQEDHDRVGIAEDGEESGGVSTGPRKTAWRGPESSAGKSSAHHPTEENGGNRGEEGYHEESEDGREVGEEVEEEEEFFDTQEGYRSDDEAFRHAFGSNALTFLHENESGGRSMVHLLDDRTGQCPPKSPERASSSVYKVVKEAMQQQQSHEQGEQPTAYTYKNWRILRAEFSLPRLQVSLWAPGSSLEVHEAETFKEIEERCLMTVWAVGFGVRYTAESFLHRLRVRLEDLTVSCRGAPPEMPLFRLGIPLPLPTFLPDLTTGTKHGSRNSMSHQQVPNRQYHPYSAVRSTSTLLSFSPPESTFPSPAGHSTFTGTSHLKPPFSADFDPPKTDGEPFRLLFQLVRDPDSAVTGRLFRSLQGSLHIAALASHLDQETVAEILRALAPLKTLMALSGVSDANNGSTPSVNGAAKAFRQATSAASDFSSSDKAGTPSSSSLNAFSSSSPSAQNVSPPSTCGAESGQSNALPLSETREQAPHIHLTLQAHGARLALVRGPQVDLLLAIGPTTFDIKPEAGGAVLACSLRVMELELQAMERETRYPHRILSHPPHAMQPVVAVTASVSTSLVLPPLRPYLAQTVAKEQRFLNVDTQVRGLSAFFPAKSMILLGQDVLKGPVIPYLAGSMDRTGACSRKADGATPFVPSSPSSSRESGVEADQSISEAVSQDGAVSGYTLGKSDVTANLHLVQSSVWLPLQDGEYGAWQDALVLKVEEFLGSYHTAPGDVASTIGVANVSSENEECSLVVKGARLEQSGEEGTTSILALEAADACMRQKPQNVHLELKLGQLSGEIEAVSVLFLLALQGHMQDVFDREWCALLTSPHAFVIFGRPSPPSLPHSRTPPALVPASAPPSFSPASLSTGSPPVTWTASEFNLGVKRSLSASLHSDGLHVTFHVGIHSIETTRSMSGRQSPLVLSGASARSQHAALILVVEELRGQLVFQGSGCVEGSTVEAAIGQVMLLHEKDHRGAETFAELVGLAKSVSRQDRDAWEAIRLSSSTTGPSRLFPEAALGEALLPHVWVRGGVKGDEQVAAEMGLYFHPTDWTLSLPGLEVVHSVASIFTQALGVQAAEPEDDLVGSEPIVDPLPHLRSSQSCSGDGRDSSAEGFFARLQSLSEGTLEENDEVIQLKLRQLLGDMTCKWPVLFASLHMEMAIGTQQVSVVESSSSTSSSVSTSSLFPSGREGMTQTEALVFQASMGIGASIIPTYSEGNTAGRGQVVKHVAGHVTAAGRGWQLMTKRISAPSPSAHFSSWASLSSRPSRGCSVLVRDESGDMHRMPSYVEAEQHVLSPFEWVLSADCNLDLSLTSPEPVIAAGVSFCVDPLEAWTFLDTRDMQHLISSTLVPVMALFNPPSPSVGEKTGDFVLDSKFQLHLVEKLPIADDNGDSRSVAWTGVPPSLKLLDYAKIRVAVSVQSARMTVINNLNRSAIPLMNVTLDGPLSLDMGATDGVVEATLRVGMRAKYFNRRLVIWEPLLEPWTVQASVMTGYIPASLDASCVIADMPNRPLLGPAAIAPPASPNYGLRKMHSFGSPRRIVSSLREKAPDFLSHSQRKRKRYFASFRATSTQVANFNITEPFLDNVMNANIGLAKADARRQILARQDSEAKAHSSEVRSVRTSDVGSKGLGEGPGEGAALHFNFVRNDTGVLLRYHASSIDVWHEVSPGTQEPLLLPPPRGGRSGSDGLQLELQRAGQHAWSALAHVDADMEGVREYSIPTLDGALRIVCEVSRVGGVKLLRIRSTELFENNCSFPLHVALKAGYGVVQWESKLTPGSQVPLPIYLAELEESSLLLSVADETEQGKVSEEPRLILEVPMPLCTADIDANESNSGGESAPSLPSAILNLADNHAAAPLNIVMGPSHNQNLVDASNSDKEMHLPGAHPSRSCGPSRTIRFSPPFLVRNALPVPMEILLRVQEEPKQGINKVWMSRLSKEDLNDANDMSLSKRFAALEIVRLRPGESCSWYGASGERNVLLWLRLPGFNWNKAKVIPSSSAMQNANMHANALEVELEDERSSQVLDVSVEVTLHELIAQQLVIYVPYWIVNITDLPLEYAHDVWDFSSDRARLGMQEGLLAGQTAKKVESGSSSWHGIRVPKEIPPYSMGRKHHQKHGPHGLGLRALLPPPASEAERLLARAKGQIVMAGYTSTASSPGMTRLSMRLHEEKSRLPGAWSRGFALPPATEGLVGFFELRTQPRPAGWASRLGPFHRGRRSARRDAVVTGGNGSSQAARRGGQQAAVPALSWGFGLSVSQHAAGGAFHRTRVVTVAPKFLLINSFGRALEVKQNGTIEDSSVPAVNLPCHGTQSVPFYWTVRTGSRYLRVRLCEFGWEWSGRFVPDVPGDVTLALRHVHVEAKCLLQVRITLEDASYVIRFRREPPSFAPYRIENRTLGSVWFVQAGLGNGGMDSEREPEVLLPYHACTFSWDEPLLDHSLELEWQAGEGGLRREYLGSFSFNPDIPIRPPAKGISVMVETRGPIRVMILTAFPLRSSSSFPPPAFGPREIDRMPGRGTEGDGRLASHTADLSVYSWVVDLEVDLRGLGISLLNGLPQELLYVSAQDLRGRWDMRWPCSRLRLTVGHLQVDDQMVNTSCPVVFVGEESKKKSGVVEGSLEAYGGRKIYGGDGLQRANALIYPSTEAGVVARGAWTNADDARVLVREGQRQSPQGLHLWPVALPHLDITVEQDLMYERILFFQAMRVKMTPYHVRLDGNLVAALLNLFSRVLTSVSEDMKEILSAKGYASYVRPAFNYDLGLMEKVSAAISPSTILSPVEHILRDTVLRGPYSQEKESISPEVAEVALHRRWDSNGGVERGIESEQICRTESGRPLVIEEDAYKVFVDYLAVDPVRIQVSFTASSMVSRVLSHLVASGPSGERFRAMKLLLDVVGSALSKVDNAPIRFSSLILRHAFSADLVKKGVAHYASQALRQAYILLGTLDVLGNPARILANISAGLRDFIYEPAKGLGQGNLWQFSMGLYRGSASLAVRVVLSLLDGIQSLASSLHAGILPLAGLIEDDSLLNARRVPTPLSRTISPISTGMSTSSIEIPHRMEGSVGGLLRGLGALVYEPIRGARRGGVRGLRAGIARGIVSVVLRPTRGFLEDVVGVCRAGRMYLQPHIARLDGQSRVRAPRLFKTRDAPLTLYSPELSMAQDMLRRVEQGSHWNEGLIFYRFFPGMTRCILLTAKHLLVVSVASPGSPGTYTLEWGLSLASLVQVDTLPPSDVLLHVISSSAEGYHPDHSSSLQQPPQGLALPSVPRSPPTDALGTSPESTDVASSLPSSGPETGRVRRNSSLGGGSTGILQHLGTWMRHSFSSQRPDLGLHTKEQLLELPDKEAVQGLIQGLRALGEYPHANYHIRVLPYFNDSDAQSLLDS